jgi:hypothetical protein
VRKSVIHLSFSFPERGSFWLETWDSARHGDPAAIGETELRYRHFGVNFELMVDDIEIVSERFVTLVDLALSLSWAVKRISAGEDAAFGFTESEEVIHLRQDGDLIAVSSSRHSLRASVERKELIDRFIRFVRAAHSLLVAEIPALSANPVIRRIYLE